MGLESATYISQLDETFPTSSDQRKEGDDHLRLIKRTLKQTFPNINGAINVSDEDLNAVARVGTKTFFVGTSAPVGWIQVTDDTATNRMLRVINTPTANIGGSHSPILMDVVPSHAHAQQGTFSSSVSLQSLNHAHAMNDVREGFLRQNLAGGGNQNDVMASPTAVPSATATADLTSHVHSVTISGNTANNVGGSNWTPRYLDTLLCQRV